MDTKLRLIFCLGLLAVAALEGPRAGALIAESARGPYGTPLHSTSAARAVFAGSAAGQAEAAGVDGRGAEEGGAELADARPPQRS